MGHSHDTLFVLMSFGIAILASWTALGLLERVRSSLELRRIMWLLATAVAMGGGIWAMHFIAMLGFKPGPEVTYDIGLTALSFLLAVVGTAGAFWMAAKPKTPVIQLLGSGALMGVAIAAMHYLGMAAIRSSAILSYDRLYIVASLAIALVASFSAMVLVREELSNRMKALGALFLAIAVSAMHYTAMAGVSVTLPEGGLHDHPQAEASALALAIAIAVISAGLLILSGVIAFLDRRIKLLSVLDAGDIGYWEVRLPSRQLWLSHHAKKLLVRNVGGEVRDHSQDLVDAAIAMAKLAIRRGTNNSKEMELHIGERWIAVRGRMLHQRNGHHIKMAGILIDITDAHSVRTALEVSDARQKLLLNELNHRLKNNFASIQSIAALTARGSPDLPTFIETFQSRILALSNTQTLLTNTGWESADLAEIFQQELHPYTQQAVIEGPSILLDPNRALSMGLIAHELTTNAAKHGALSRVSGTIRVRWTVPDRQGRVRLEWIESGGPTVKPPSRRGFGSRLIKNSIEGPLAGTAEYNYPPSGLNVIFQFSTIDEARPKTTTASRIKVITPVE
ncbi:MHYT domain-containing protein [uncultured Brevundimonas sp.]|uniref:MHYT domain-containing protein n=1 Tax=uncultured Brevundimonas sp. TaxID=213418 RepID=UPI00262FFC4E|nr:MHYT domain-containing protein [uncultured Brevundimonas sp.]